MECGRSGKKRGPLLNSYNISSIFMFIIFLTSTIRCSGLRSGGEPDYSHADLKRSSFPVGFKFGVGSSAYQYEGAVDKGGRFPSIWDFFTRLFPEKIADGSSGVVADKFYFHYEEDAALLQEVGWDFFRFSISWSRVIPYGKISKGINQEGIDFYNKLIDSLLARGVQPYVTLFHWDVPQALEDDYGGFLSHNIVDDYRDYAELCFKKFGDKVKYWVTLNEPYTLAVFGYATGVSAPGRCSNYIGNCTVGDSATEPYVVMHNLLLAHAAAVQVYRNMYQTSQNGQIGISMPSTWMKPKYNTSASKEAASRAMDFQLGWQAHPITYGDYPSSMRSLVGDRLPKFTQQQSDMLKGSYDFFGINYYTANYVDQSTSYSYENPSSTTDCRSEKDGVPIGMGEANNHTLPIEDALKDVTRIDFFRQHMLYLAKAIEEGVRVKGYLVWTFLDDFEWEDGYTLRYGLTYVDYNDGLKRYLKQSSLWFKIFLRKDITSIVTSPDLYNES